MVDVVGSVREVRERVDPVRAAGARVVLVPTMGNLHAGHAALVRRAHRLGDFVVATIFVNPLQFGANEDFGSYPRTLQADLDLLAADGCSLALVPDVREVYPHGPDRVTRVEVPGLGDALCGAFRPGFFRGVATVVHILFGMVRPDVAVFGEKDYQQLLVVRQMVRELYLSVEIVGEPTVREPDGLAISSRNGYLGPEERERAPMLYRVLRDAAAAVRAGECDREAVEARSMRELTVAGFRPDYVAVRRAEDLALPGPGDGDLRVLGAAWLGRARLIDNVAV